jgi:16S rRNA U1498 N3-methylase RsmE
MMNTHVKDVCYFSIILCLVIFKSSFTLTTLSINHVDSFVIHQPTRWNVAASLLLSPNKDKHPYHSRLFNPLLRQRKDDFDAIEANQTKHTISDLEEAKYHNLPRMYVGELSSSLHELKREGATRLSKNARIKLSKDQSHYLLKVMRFFKKGKKKKNSAHTHNFMIGDTETVDINQCVRLFDGVNGEWLAKIIEPSNGEKTGNLKRSRKSDANIQNELEAECLTQLRSQPTNECRKSWVMFAPIKKQRLKLMVEKCTELGAELFCPIITDHTDTILGTDKELLGPQSELLFGIDNVSKTNEIDKLPLIAREASEQSERLDVPTFVTSLDVEEESDTNVSLCNISISIKTLLETLDTSPLFDHRTLLVCRERQNDSVVPTLQAFDINKSSNKRGGVVFLVGPEGVSHSVFNKIIILSALDTNVIASFSNFISTVNNHLQLQSYGACHCTAI